MHRKTFTNLNLMSENNTQTCHSIERKNQDLTIKKSGSGGKKSGSWSYRLQKEITHPKKECFELSDKFVCVVFMSSLSVCVCVCVFQPFVFFKFRNKTKTQDFHTWNLEIGRLLGLY